MKDQIKRMAQLLFDNAEYIADELGKGDLFRSLHIEFNDHKTGESSKQVSVWVNSEGECHRLDDEFAEIDNIKRTWDTVNINTGEIPRPEPIETRGKL